MKWNLPPDGAVKIVRRFLLFPKTLKNERRWLEVAYIRYEFDYGQWWFERGWATKEQYDKQEHGINQFA